MRTLRIAMLLAGTIMAGTCWGAGTGGSSCNKQARSTFLGCRAQCMNDFVATTFACNRVNPTCGIPCLAGWDTCGMAVNGVLQTGIFPDGSMLASCADGTDGCKTRFDGAVTACGAPCAPTDQTCSDCVDAAEVTAFTCRDSCRDSWRTDPRIVAMIKNCRNVFKSCVHACQIAG